MPLPSAPRSVIHGAAVSRHRPVRAALHLLDAGDGALHDLAAEIADGLAGGRAGVKVDRPSRLLYATDASIYEMEPLAVVYPRSAADVAHVLRVAARRGLPVLPRGAGTSLAGQTLNHAVVLDFTPHMDRIVQIDATERWARVQPGVVLAQLNRALRDHGLHYPIDPSTANRATIGGGVGNNSCGSHSAVYGKTVDNVAALDLLFADATAARFTHYDPQVLAAKRAQPGLEGDIYRAVERLTTQYRDEIRARFPKLLRRVSGYNLDALLQDPADLAPLIVGSEGTLALVTEATVRLAPLPICKGLAVVHLHSVVEAAEATVVANRQQPSAVELVDATIIDRCRQHPSYASLVERVQGAPGALLLVEFYGDSADELTEKLGALAAALERERLGYATVVTLDPDQQRAMWRMREIGLGILMSVRGDAKPLAFVEDTAVDPDRLPQFVARFDALIRDHGFTAAYYGHASVGCLHIRPHANIKDAAELVSMQRLAERIADLVVEFQGSLSGEHGDGILRGVFMERMFGAPIVQAFRELKTAFDPDGLLNPGKIIDVPPFADNLRLGPQTVNREPPTYLSFAADGGIARAVELCNGQGACRKFDGGMCPSYMVTKDEEHSTRGRANLLRQALNGVLPPQDLAGERIHEALDLCVECKACKSECPSGVDLAKLKYETLAYYHDVHGLPGRARAFAHIRTLARAAAPFAPLVNAAGRVAPLRLLLEKTAGIHRARPIPVLAREPFPRSFARRRAATFRPPAPRGEVVFFHDTFTDYFYPEVGHAAVAILEALGYGVRLVDGLVCCGRPAISKGMLGTARKWARRNIEALRPFAAAGIPIVGVEPSCLLALRDEYPDLIPGPETRIVAEHAFLLDQLLVRLVHEEPALADRFLPARRSLLLHAHCHQKALAGTDATLRALQLAGFDTILIDSGCCGMAGSFGFEAEHYDISRRMGALALFPAVQAAPVTTEIAITGVSCRQQIDHCTGRRARHVVEFLAGALRPDETS